MFIIKTSRYVTGYSLNLLIKIFSEKIKSLIDKSIIADIRIKKLLN